ncbi:MAG: hypothetical protein QOF48_723, partial [Verrucomicrobiota bacterium]
MFHFLTSALPMFRVFTLFAACFVASTLCGLAQTISNPSFEANVFTVAPGSVSANTPITGWSFTDNTKAGLSPAGALNTFANNGVIPNGTNVLYLQTTNVASTVISGLTPGFNYTLRFRANSQNATTPTLRVSLDGASLLDAGSVVSVGGVLPYQFVALNFAAAAASQTLYITNDAVAVTSVLLLDDFSVALSTGGWSVTSWTNDVSSGIDSTKNYSHAYAFGVTGTNVLVNGVFFTRIAGGGPQVPYEFQSVNVASTTTDAANVLRTAAGGTSSNLAFGFVYNGNPEIFNLDNLVPGVEYVTTFYSVGWDPRAYGRAVTWTVGNDRLSVNEDQFGDGVGIRISYRYFAPASGYLSISNFPFSAAVGTFHTFALANYEANPQTLPIIGIQPASKASIPSGGVGFYVTAGGARPLDFRWSKGAVEIPGQTNRTLILSNLAAGDLAQYRVSVSNAFGVVVSSPATLSFETATIPNPSFEADTFFNAPGYSSVNFPITGWISSNPGRTGINPETDIAGPFVNNGVVPDGRQAAFIQGTAANSLRTTLSGLIAGSNYTVQFRANARAGQKPTVHVGIDGVSVLDTLHNNVTGTNAYRLLAFDFTAAAATAVMSLTNDTVADTTVAIDNFTIAPSTTRWSYASWTNDATAGIDTTKLYTHAFHFGPSVVDTTINGLVFRGISGANPSVSGFFSTAGFPSTFTGDVNIFNTTGGGSAGMASQFVYGGTVQSITLTNLLPGTEYVASIYSVAFDTRTTGRAATFNVGSDRMTINQDHFGLDNGIIVSYRYVADASGAITLTYTPTDGTPSSFHTYALANRVAVDSAPVIGAQPINAFVAVGDTASLAVGLNAGSLPIYYQWQCNGVDLAGQTNSILILSNLAAFGTNGYRLVVTNFLGSVTSRVAIVEVGTRLAELFNTGVDETNAFLGGGFIDAHYKLITHPDPNFQGPEAVTMHNGAFPLLANYFTNGLFSSWIAPRTNSSIGNSNGFYVYRTSFIIDTADAAHAQINGRWSSDNEGIDILLNGSSLGISNPVSAAFGTFVPFTITNGFLTGSNIIDFVISNGPAPGPTALRAEMSGVGLPLSALKPQILVQPANTTVIENSEATIGVVVRGSGPLTYQWYYFGFLVPGQTNRVLRLPHVAADQDGVYSVTISNGAGVTNSMDATLTVLLPPVVLADPPSQTVRRTQTAVFSILVDGTSPFTYQWYFSNAPISGATSDTLTINNVQLIHAGGYYVAVTNSAGGIVSATAVLTVPTNDPPVAVNDGAATSQNRAVGLAFVKLLVNDSDPDGDALTVISTSATSTNGGGLQLTSTNIIYTPVNGFSGNDRFTYTISDGHDNTASAQVELFVANGNLPSANVVVLSSVPGGYSITFAGVPGKSYDI